MATERKHAIQSERRGLRIVGMTSTGAVNDAIVRFSAAATPLGSYALATWVTVTDSADNGTTFKFVRRGKYACTFALSSNAVGTPTQLTAISLDTTLLTVDPTAADLSIRSRSLKIMVAAQVETHWLSCVVHISDTLAGGAATGVVRFHATNGAGATIVLAGVDLTTVWASIEYIGDASGGT